MIELDHPRIERQSYRTVRHRWNLRPGEDPPQPDDVIIGAREHWRVVAVEPVESEKYPHAFRGTMERLGACDHAAWDTGPWPAWVGRIWVYRRST